MRSKQRLTLLLVTLLTAGCAVERPQAPPKQMPAPAPAPVRPAPPPISQPVPPPPRLEWQDLPLSPGSWMYDGRQPSQAAFGASDPGFILRCDLQNRQMILLRPGVTTGNTMIVRTSEVRRALPISVTSDASATAYASLNVEDPMLDNVAFSRGRFTIEVPGLPMLVMPSWAEPARVIEECRR